MLAVVLPTMILLLNPGNPPMHNPAVTQLLSFATADPDAFKEVAGKLPPDILKLMEDSVKEVLGNSKVGTIDTSLKPQISLRSF